jgi:cytochrome c
MLRMRLRAILFSMMLTGAGALGFAAHAQELRGHGGPVRGIAVSGDGLSAMSVSFDQSAIIWRLDQGAAIAVLRFHEGAVNAVVALPGGRFATGGEDGRIALWSPGAATPERVIADHAGSISGLSISPDGSQIISASWDATIRVTPLAGGPARVLSGHKGPVAGVAMQRKGKVVSIGHDASLRIWGAAGDAATSVQLDAAQNGIVIASDGEIITAGTDGKLRFFAPDGSAITAIEVAPTPLVALALSPDGSMVATGGLRGQVPLIARASRSVQATLVGPGLPVWSLAFAPDGQVLLSGGADRLVRRWNARTGEHIGTVVPQAGANVLAGLDTERGAQVFRACAACHTLTPDGGNRAGPTLHGVFGRRIASAPGYNFSAPLTKMDIIWSAETISRLFEIGPTAYTPGTKMPEQVISSAQDRKALVEWLERVTQKP